MRNTAHVTGGNPIAIRSQSISGVIAINPFVAFYDIHGRKREVSFFYFIDFLSGPQTTIPAGRQIIGNLRLGTALTKPIQILLRFCPCVSIVASV
jgi:hypothetical protein